MKDYQNKSSVSKGAARHVSLSDVENVLTMSVPIKAALVVGKKC